MEITSLQDVVLHSKLPSFEALRPAQEPASPINGLDKLVQELHRIFRDDVVNIEHVSEVMASYQSNPSDWKKFAKFDRFRYTRNLVDEGNGKFNLMILCWGPDHGSAVHDHADAHCFMKMLQGTLSEVRFSWPDSQLDSRPDQQLQEEEADEEGRPLEEISRTDLRLNDVCYINGKPRENHRAMETYGIKIPWDSTAWKTRRIRTPPCRCTFTVRPSTRAPCSISGRGSGRTATSPSGPSEGRKSIRYCGIWVVTNMIVLTKSILVSDR
ncbi:hypothetical protein FOCC_FOCC016040 [Frankliniella occidentalis]|nr:hypothetical protein FOCC_FOCC016040 [Frankliniella occidentalis]